MKTRFKDDLIIARQSKKINFREDNVLPINMLGKYVNFLGNYSGSEDINISNGTLGTLEWDIDVVRACSGHKSDTTTGKLYVPLYIIHGGTHSMPLGDIVTDIPLWVNDVVYEDDTGLTATDITDLASVAKPYIWVVYSYNSSNDKPFITFTASADELPQNVPDHTEAPLWTLPFELTVDKFKDEPDPTSDSSTSKTSTYDWYIYNYKYLPSGSPLGSYKNKFTASISFTDSASSSGKRFYNIDGTSYTTYSASKTELYLSDESPGGSLLDNVPIGTGPLYNRVYAEYPSSISYYWGRKRSSSTVMELMYDNFLSSSQLPKVSPNTHRTKYKVGGLTYWIYGGSNIYFQILSSSRMCGRFSNIYLTASNAIDTSKTGLSTTPYDEVSKTQYLPYSTPDCHTQGGSSGNYKNDWNIDIMLPPESMTQNEREAIYIPSNLTQIGEQYAYALTAYALISNLTSSTLTFSCRALGYFYVKEFSTGIIKKYTTLTQTQLATLGSGATHWKKYWCAQDQTDGITTYDGDPSDNKVAPIIIFINWV